jgi:hypothetical protein
MLSKAWSYESLPEGDVLTHLSCRQERVSSPLETYDDTSTKLSGCRNRSDARLLVSLNVLWALIVLLVVFLRLNHNECHNSDYSVIFGHSKSTYTLPAYGLHLLTPTPQYLIRKLCSAQNWIAMKVWTILLCGKKFMTVSHSLIILHPMRLPLGTPCWDIMKLSTALYTFRIRSSTILLVAIPFPPATLAEKSTAYQHFISYTVLWVLNKADAL